MWSSKNFGSCLSFLFLFHVYLHVGLSVCAIKKETTKPKQNKIKRKHQETDADCQLTYDSPKVIITPSVLL